MQRRDPQWAQLGVDNLSARWRRRFLQDTRVTFDRP